MNRLRLFCLIAWLTASSVAAASQYRGQATFGGLPLPGATVTATQDNKKFVAITDQQGLFSFPDLPDGKWTIEIEMQCFSPIRAEVDVVPSAPAGKWEMKLLPMAQIKPEVVGPGLAPAKFNGEATTQDNNEQVEQRNNTLLGASAPEGNLSELAENGFLINGSVLNGGTSPFAQMPVFGNNRLGGNGLYNGGIGVIFDNSALDARPFSLSGQSAPKPAYNRITGVATLGGPLRIPRLLPNGPNFFVGYQWARNVSDITQSALVPSVAERNGDFSNVPNALGQPVDIFDPTTGLPFPGNVIPSSRISAQAKALLSLYPSPNLAGRAPYNFQVPIVSHTHQDALESRLDKTLGAKDQLYGSFAFQSTRTDNPNLFGFLDTTQVLEINSGVNWSHRLNQGTFLNLGYRYSRMAPRTTPYFENRENVSGQAGISGNNQDAMNWGPPTLAFASGIAGLSDAQFSFDRNQTSAWSYSLLWNRGRHNFTLGGDFRRQEFNFLSQQDPRGAFTFTGAATRGGNAAGASGFDFADFLLGIPDTSSVAFGNADKYFRESVYDAYFTDDYRISPELTLNAGMRWEYGAPVAELFGRLVNLDIAPGFAAVAPVAASDPRGPLTGRRYPNSLIQADKSAFEPRVGIAWRPIGGSSLVVRAAYGVYYDTSLYPTMALQMAQQAPLSKSLSVENSAACPLTLANGFTTCPLITSNTFAIDPRFRVGYAQNWNLAVQRDLPGSLQMTAKYLGTKGTRGLQEFLPNTFPIEAVNPCPACPTGFAYFASNGNSTRQAGQIQLRRRLHNGLTGTVEYTYSKAIDDDSVLGGQAASSAPPRTPTIAQNWLDLKAERGLSTFDQRHLLSFEMQYTTGMGLGGETLLSGRKGTLFKEWTFLGQITAGSGFPESPVYLAGVPGTGVTGTMRPDYTGAPIYAARPGLFLNPEAYTAPQPGEWGNAGRDSIIGPSQFSLNASLGRTFRLNRFNLDLRIDSTNLLNHPTFTSWNATVNSAQFGLPLAVNPMRSAQATLRLRF